MALVTLDSQDMDMPAAGAEEESSIVSLDAPENALTKAIP